ncbi:MAG TPA: stage II sporulation protein P [Bacillota bacterium]|nr:stage II sporulation protein P [Bacillota bacterium]
MNKKWLFAFFVIPVVVVLIIFAKWLYAPNAYVNELKKDANLYGFDPTDSIEVFNYDIKKKLELKRYSDNFYIQILNTVITGAKVSYEKDYGSPMPGLLASAVSSITDGLHTDISNPLTYLNIAFTAFSQYDPSVLTYEGLNIGGSVNTPHITDFENAPEGAIYFSEEDEYKSEELIPGQQPMASDTAQASQTIRETIGIPGKIALDKKSPQILIYHSHSTESYMPNTAGNYHTLEEKYNVISVGNILTKEIQDKYKYKVLHDKTQHDKVSYAYSYSNSLITIKNSINKYKSIKVILDLHRDAFDADKYTYAEKIAKKAEYTASINGKNAARIMLVIAQGNPNYDELEKFAVYIKRKMDILYPGLFLKIDVKSRGKYNQYFSNHSVLVEVGCMLNTIEEAKYSAELFSRVLGEVINDLKE